MTRAGAGAGALLHLLLALGLLLVLGLLFCLPHLPGLLAWRRPDLSAPLAHQSLGGRAQVLGGGRALSLDPLDVVDGVRPLLGLTWIFARFISHLLLARVRRRFGGLQLALMTHGGGTADDEDHDDEKGGHDDDDEQILLQEVHDASEDEVLQADHGDGDGVGDGAGEGGSSSGSRDLNRRSSGDSGWKKELQLGFIPAAVHGCVVEQRSGVAQREQRHAGDERKHAGIHLLLRVLQRQQWLLGSNKVLYVFSYLM